MFAAGNCLSAPTLSNRYLPSVLLSSYSDWIEKVQWRRVESAAWAATKKLAQAVFSNAVVDVKE